MIPKYPSPRIGIFLRLSLDHGDCLLNHNVEDFQPVLLSDSKYKFLDIVQHKFSLWHVRFR